MNEGLIPNRYAKALYAYANEAGKAAEVYDATLRLSRAFEAEARLARAVENPFLDCCGVISKSEGKQLRESVAAQRGIDAEMWK